MLSNYFTIAWRNLRKNGRFSIINIAGLTIGIAANLLIFLWVYTERNWNKHNTHYDNIYHVMSHRDFNGEINTGPDMMYPLAAAAMESFPEVEAAAVVSFPSSTLFTADDTKLRRSTLITSPRFFDIFSADFIEGNAAALKDPDAVVLTASTARALFGPGNVVGRTVTVNNGKSYTVKAVVDDMPASATVQFEALIPFNPSEQRTIDASTDWINCGNRVFYRTKPGANIPALEKKTIQLIRAKVRSENPTTRGTVTLHSMNKWRLHEEFTGGKNTGGRISYVKLFMWIALIILVIACVNFMNLSTARSEKRAKEVGIRKTLGTERRQLIFQFITESVVITAISCVLAVSLVLIIRPEFEKMMDMQLALPLTDPVTYALLVAIIVVTGLLAGSYPAVYLSGFNPIKVIKGTYLPGKQALLPRKILVTAQFVISIVLISASLLVYQQIQYVKSRDIGYDINNLIMVSSSSETEKNFEAFENDLLATGLVQSITRTSTPITEMFGYTSGVSVPGAAAQTNPVLGFLFANNGFANTVGVKLLQGRDFRQGDTGTVMFSQSALQLLNIKDPIGREINWAGRNFKIVGIVNDMVMESPYQKPSPLMVTYEPNWSERTVMRLRPGADPRNAIAAIEKAFNRYSPSYPFEYRFVDDAFNTKFVNEQLIGKLSVLFTSLAIFVCCLGLFGLVSFTIERRYKEIGIRKVLGANARQLLFLMSKEFLMLVGVALAIAVPLAWWALSEWLTNYAYRTSISPLLFIGVGFITMVIALITVGLNASQAGIQNPVKSLRSE